MTGSAGVGVGVVVGVHVRVGVDVLVGVKVFVGVLVGVNVRVGVEVLVGVCVAVGVAVGRKSSSTIVRTSSMYPLGVCTRARTCTVCPCNAARYFTHDSASPGWAFTWKLNWQFGG
jgi:hypothetical protein